MYGSRVVVIADGTSVTMDADTTMLNHTLIDGENVPNSSQSK
jgi:hypothetical protein